MVDLRESGYRGWGWQISGSQATGAGDGRPQGVKLQGLGMADLR